MSARSFALPAALPAWDRPRELDCPELPVLKGDMEADLCVVGLGGSGLACARKGLALGLRVVGIDAGSVGSGAAGRNGGFLLAGTADFYHDAVDTLGRERARALYVHTLAEIERMASETPAAVRLVGSLRIAADDAEAEDCDRQLEAMRADRLPVEPYSGPEGRGLLFPTDGAFQPLQRCRLLAARALAYGARLFEHSPALDVSTGEVHTPRGTIFADRIVVAVDGALDRIIPELSGRVRTARLQMVGTAPTNEVRLPRPVYSRWGYDYWQQLPCGRVVLGGFRDRHEAEEWTHDAEPTDAVQRLLERHLREVLGVHAPITHRWAASVGYTDDGIPVLEEVRPGVWATGAYSGTGNVIGALCGRAAAALAFGRTSEIAPLIRGA